MHHRPADPPLSARPPRATRRRGIRRRAPRRPRLGRTLRYVVVSLAVTATVLVMPVVSRVGDAPAPAVRDASSWTIGSRPNASGTHASDPAGGTAGATTPSTPGDSVAPADASRAAPIGEQRSPATPEGQDTGADAVPPESAGSGSTVSPAGPAASSAAAGPAQTPAPSPPGTPRSAGTGPSPAPSAATSASPSASTSASTSPTGQAGPSTADGSAEPAPDAEHVDEVAPAPVPGPGPSEDDDDDDSRTERGRGRHP